MTVPTHVYIIARYEDSRWLSPVKIGVANNPRARLRTISTSSPFNVEIYKMFVMPTREIALAVENAFHTVKAHERLHGEWFGMAPDFAHLCMMANIMAHLDHQGFSPDKINELLKVVCVDG